MTRAFKIVEREDRVCISGYLNLPTSCLVQSGLSLGHWLERALERGERNDAEQAYVMAVTDPAI